VPASAVVGLAISEHKPAHLSLITMPR
jgi:hypothetical protein